MKERDLQLCFTLCVFDKRAFDQGVARGGTRRNIQVQIRVQNSNSKTFYHTQSHDRVKVKTLIIT